MAALPVLSRYLGHSGIKGTQKHLQLTAQMHPDIAGKMEERFGCLIPLPRRIMKPSDFSVLLTRYLMHYLTVQRNLSSNTIKSYRDAFKLPLTFCRDEKNMNIAKLALKQLDKKCIEDFLIWLLQSRGASPSTYNQRLSAIHAFFDYVMTEES
ncbi:MAG: site-specific integrase [Clostridiales bacterium]|nr:site-specific integrase [Clostridiales bacterium]